MTSRARPSNRSGFTQGPDFVALGGAHGCIQVRWLHTGPNSWSVVPEPKLTASVRACYGAELGRVTYDPAAHACHGLLISRHRRDRKFSGVVYNAHEACDSLRQAIGDTTFNPMWVDGFDTVLGPSDDLMPRGPLSPSVDNYALEWGDRLGEAINNFRATRTRATTRAAKGAAGHLGKRFGQAVGLVKQRKFDVSTLEGRRVVLLTVDAQGLLKDAVAHDACARSMSAAEWSDFLTVTGVLTLSIWL